MSFNAASLIERHAAERPDAPALAFPSRSAPTQATTWDRWTYAELDLAASEYAAGFRAMGVRPGERTLLLIKPSLDFFAVVFGLLKIDATPVILDPRMGFKAVLGCIGQIRPQGLVAIPPVHAVRQVFRGPFSELEHVVTDGARWFWGGSTLAQVRAAGAAAPARAVDVAADDQAAIIFTSGSTGPAKGVSLRYGAFWTGVHAIRELYDLGPGTTIVECFAPFALYDLAMGSSVILPDMDLSAPATASPARVVDAITAHQADTAFASPIVWVNTVRWCQAQGVQLPTLRQVLSAGAPIPADLHRRFRQVLAPGAQVHTPYGCTEGMPVATIASDAILAETQALTASGAGTCVGYLAPQMEVRVMRITDEALSDWTDDLRLPAGDIGEVVLCGDVVSREYVERPDANAVSKLRDGELVLHRMGDLGYFDEQGRLWFCGRKAHRLETASGMVPAVPVEGVFNEHPKVRRTALVGVGASGAERPVLIVQLEPGQTWEPGDEAALLALATGTRWEGLVTQVMLHPSFPVDPRHNSKIRREELKVWASSRAGGSS